MGKNVTLELEQITMYLVSYRVCSFAGEKKSREWREEDVH